MKISVVHHELSFRSGGTHGGQPLGNLCRQYLAVDSASMEALTSQDQNQKQNLLCWNHLGSDSSIDPFHPDGTLLPILNSDDSKLSPQSDSQMDEENHLQPLIDRGPAELSQKQFCLAEVNPTSFEVTPCHHHEHRELHHEQAINLCYPTGNHVQSLSSLPADVDLASSDGEPPLHPTLFISERHCERPSSEEAPSIRVRLMCSFGGRIIPRPIDGKLRYAGGETRIVTVARGISFTEFMSKMAQFYGSPLGLKYQLPDEDLDALVSVSSDDDLQNMMEEYDKIESGGTLASRLRLFFFSSPAEVEVSENGLKMELEDGCVFLEQRYVDAINGVPEKLHGSLLENDVVGFRQADALNNVDNSGRMPLHDLANVTTHSKGPSVPSSFPSSPPLAPRQEAYGKPPALGDISLQSLNERLSKVTISSSGFEGDFDQDGSGSSSSTSQHDYQYHQDHQHHEQQFYVPADSPRVTHHDLSVSRGDNWPGMCCIDSQTKLARQSEQYMDYRTSAGGPMDQWHDMQQPSNTLLPQVEHQRFVHQHKHIPQKKHHHQHQHQHQYQHHHQHRHRHRHQQAWQLQIDGETGRSEHCVQDMYKQPQAFHQLHHPPACHCSHQIVAAHDGSSWNTEHHTTPLFFQGSTQNHPQIPHGLAPAPPYQMGSAPSSPRDAVHDYQGKCSCGLQHSQVHRGITVSIGDQFHNRWLPHSGDHPSRRHGLLSSSRFCDNVSYCAHSSVWQQPSHVTGTDEAEHREQIGNPLQHFHGRHPMDCQLAECQARSRALQYCEPPSNNEAFLPSHDRHETNKRCLSICSHDNRKQPMENTMIHSAYPGMQDQVTEWVSNQKGFQLDSGRVSASRKDFPRISLHKDEDCRGEFADEKCIEGELELYLPLKPGDFELRRAMETPIDGMPGMPYARKPPIPAVSVIRPLVSEELLVSQPLSTLAQGGSEWHPKLASLKTSAEVPNSWSMTSLEPGVCADLLPSWHGQASNRLMEEVSELPSSKEMPRSNFDSSFLLVVEGANNSIQTGRFMGKTVHDHGACTSESWEDYGQPSAARRAAGEALEPLPASSSGYEFVDAGCDGVRVSATHGDAHLLSPDVIPLGSLAATAAAPHMQQAIPAATLTMNTLDDSLNTPASPIYDLSPLSSTNATDFSFVPSKTRSLPAEANIDNEAFASHMSVTELLADGMISSVLKSCSNEGFLEENKDVDQQVAATDSHQEPNHLMCENGMEKDTRTALLGLNSLLPSVIEQGKGWSVTEASTVNGWLKVGVQEEKSEEVQIMQSDVTKKTSYKDKDSEVENSHVGETKEPALSQAESEAIARGLQIIRNSDLEDLKELGSGTFGTVYHGKWRGSDVAIKRIKASCFTGPPLEQERMISDFWKEACTLGQLHHPNVVAFYGVVPDGPGGTLATVTEYMVNGSLKQVLHKKDRTIDRRKRLFIAMDAAFGMEYLHSKNIVHFDLKCENLLVNMRDAHRPICKVGDFGLSKVKHQTLVSGGVRGTLPWMAPELLSGNCLVTEKIDVFSFGVVMWELLTGEEPYANLHCGAIISGIVNNTLRPSIPSWCDPRWRNLMEQCWSGNPAERPAFAEVSKELREIYASMNIK